MAIILRIRNKDFRSITIPDSQFFVYKGCTSAAVPKSLGNATALPLKVLPQQLKSVQNAKQSYLLFLRSVLSDGSGQEFSGFNTKIKQDDDQVHSLPSSEIYYPLLINHSPSDFLCCVGSLMTSAGIVELLGKVFSSVTKMLIGK